MDEITEAQRPKTEALLPAATVLPLLRALPGLGNTTTVVLLGGCVFEFKGPFPAGVEADGFYNLNGPTPGFHGHLRLNAITHVKFQDRPHRGRASYAFVFQDETGRAIFKVFLGRRDDGEVLDTQLHFFRELRKTGHIPNLPELKS